MRIQTLTPRIGAEILDVDLSRITDARIGEIRAALIDHHVVFFRDQNLTPQQFKEFAQGFGKLALNHNPRNRLVDHPEIVCLAADERSTSIPGDTFHSDGAADPEPPMGSILLMREMPTNNGGDTIFANTCAAYEALSDSMKQFLDGLTAINDRAYGLRGLSGIYSQQTGDGAPVSEHPVIRVHPESGRKGIFVNRAYTTHIKQLDRPQSDALLGSLFNLVESPLFQCRFKWRPGSIAFWDNRCTQHYAVWDYYPHRRLAHRITIAGERPYGPSHQQAANHENGFGT